MHPIDIPNSHTHRYLQYTSFKFNLLYGRYDQNFWHFWSYFLFPIWILWDNNNKKKKTGRDVTTNKLNVMQSFNQYARMILYSFLLALNTLGIPHIFAVAIWVNRSYVTMQYFSWCKNWWMLCVLLDPTWGVRKSIITTWSQPASILQAWSLCLGKSVPLSVCKHETQNYNIMCSRIVW